MRQRITDWDDAYANGPNIPYGDQWPARWVEPARRYRETLSKAGHAQLGIRYADGDRNLFDLFVNAERSRGLVVFIHGGFWLRLDKSYWSHLARGPVEHGFSVAIPSYTLCPDTRISAITVEIGTAIEKAAELVEGPIHLIGHSAGGHLVTRMITMTSPLPDIVRSRVFHTLSLSGLHDLRPLMNTTMNGQLKIDRQEAWRESPVLLEPMPDTRLTCWVGAGERSEFLRQNALLANIWRGLGAETAIIEEPDRHHFNIVDGLADPDHLLTRTLLS